MRCANGSERDKSNHYVGQILNCHRRESNHEACCFFCVALFITSVELHSAVRSDCFVWPNGYYKHCPQQKATSPPTAQKTKPFSRPGALPQTPGPHSALGGPRLLYSTREKRKTAAKEREKEKTPSTYLAEQGRTADTTTESGHGKTNAKPRQARDKRPDEGNKSEGPRSKKPKKSRRNKSRGGARSGFSSRDAWPCTLKGLDCGTSVERFVLFR